MATRELYMDTLSFMAMEASEVEKRRVLFAEIFPCLLRRSQRHWSRETLELCYQDAFDSLTSQMLLIL